MRRSVGHPKLSASRRASLVLALVASSISALGCSSGNPEARRIVREKHMPAVARIVRDDINRHLVAVTKSAERLEPIFAAPDPVQREQQARALLKRLRHPIRGVNELASSPSTFIAVTDLQGICIARDLEPDPMKGTNLAQLFTVVSSALARGVRGYALGEFPASQTGGKPSVTEVFAAPIRHDGQIVGALVLGIPLWKIAQKLSSQLQVDNPEPRNLILWAYVYRGSELHYFGTPPELDGLVPDAATRARGLSASHGGFTGDVLLSDNWYGYGVMPLPSLGPDVGVIVFRGTPG